MDSRPLILPPDLLDISLWIFRRNDRQFGLPVEQRTYREVRDLAGIPAGSWPVGSRAPRTSPMLQS